MHNRPWILLVFSSALVLIALSLPVQVHFLYEVPFWSIGEIFQHLTRVNIILMVSLVATAVATVRAHKWTPVTLLITGLLLAFNNWWVGYVGLDYSMGASLLALFGYGVLHFLLLESRARSALRSHKVQWFRAAKRKRYELPVTIFPWVGEPIRASTFDISTSGAFLNLSTTAQMRVGDRMQMRVHLSHFQDIRFTARLVRKANASGRYPEGMAVHFEDMGVNDKKMLKQALGS